MIGTPARMNGIVCCRKAVSTLTVTRMNRTSPPRSPPRWRGTRAASVDFYVGARQNLRHEERLRGHPCTARELIACPSPRSPSCHPSSIGRVIRECARTTIVRARIGITPGSVRTAPR